MPQKMLTIIWTRTRLFVCLSFCPIGLIFTGRLWGTVAEGGWSEWGGGAGWGRWSRSVCFSSDKDSKLRVEKSVRGGKWPLKEWRNSWKWCYDELNNYTGLWGRLLLLMTFSTVKGKGCGINVEIVILPLKSELRWQEIKHVMIRRWHQQTPGLLVRLLWHIP